MGKKGSITMGTSIYIKIAPKIIDPKDWERVYDDALKIAEYGQLAGLAEKDIDGYNSLREEKDKNYSDTFKQLYNKCWSQNISSIKRGKSGLELGGLNIWFDALNKDKFPKSIFLNGKDDELS